MALLDGEIYNVRFILPILVRSGLIFSNLGRFGGDVVDLVDVEWLWWGVNKLSSLFS